MIAIITVGITTPMAMFWCVLWLSGLFLDVGADTTLDSVEDVDSEQEDWDEEKDEGEDDGEKGDEADDLGGKDSVVCATLRDDSDNNEFKDLTCSAATLAAETKSE